MGEHARQWSSPQVATMIPFMSKKKKFKFQVSEAINGENGSEGVKKGREKVGRGVYT